MHLLFPSLSDPQITQITPIKKQKSESSTAYCPSAFCLLIGVICVICGLNRNHRAVELR